MSPPLLLTLQFFTVTHAVHWNHIIVQKHHDYQPVSLNVMFSTRLSDVVCLQWHQVWCVVVSVLMRPCAGGQEQTSVSPVGTFSTHQTILVCPPVRTLEPLSEWHVYTHTHVYTHHTCIRICANITRPVSVLCCSCSLYRHYYGDRDSKQCRLCHPLCDGACSGKVFSIFFYFCTVL